MLKSITNWWNKDKIAAAETAAANEAIAARFELLEQHMQQVAAEKQDVAAKLSEAEDQLNMYRTQDAADEARRNGTEPWVEVRSAHVDPVKGIQIELDWNVAFVQYLKDNGLTGRDDETIVQKWLAFLYEDLINRLEDQVINNSDKAKVSDFV